MEPFWSERSVERGDAEAVDRLAASEWRIDPIELRHPQFGGSARRYDARTVDRFLSRFADRVETANRLVDALLAEREDRARQLDAMRSREGEAAARVAEADRRAAEILEEARTQARALEADAEALRERARVAAERTVVESEQAAWDLILADGVAGASLDESELGRSMTARARAEAARIVADAREEAKRVVERERESHARLQELLDNRRALTQSQVDALSERRNNVRSELESILRIEQRLVSAFDEFHVQTEKAAAALRDAAASARLAEEEAGSPPE